MAQSLAGVAVAGKAVGRGLTIGQHGGAFKGGLGKVIAKPINITIGGQHGMRDVQHTRLTGYAVAAVYDNLDRKSVV